ncbi:HEPN domain-containing protein [Cyanobium sp. ATX 6F1]|nr:HEPN domain-containing protein [Cyanobium sp. ATX 6F1]
MLVRRHLLTLSFGLDPSCPAEDWGFTAQQAVEKLLKTLIVLRDQRPPRSHELADLAALAELALDPLLLKLQPFAVEARYEEGPFALPAERTVLMGRLEALLAHCEAAVARAARP